MVRLSSAEPTKSCFPTVEFIAACIRNSSGKRDLYPGLRKSRKTELGATVLAECLALDYFGLSDLGLGFVSRNAHRRGYSPAFSRIEDPVQQVITFECGPPSAPSKVWIFVTKGAKESSISTSTFQRPDNIVRMPSSSERPNQLHRANSRRQILRWFCAGLTLAAGVALPRAASEFDAKIKPILSEYCYDCHGDGAKKGSVTLDEFKSDKDVLA